MYTNKLYEKLKHANYLETVRFPFRAFCWSYNNRNCIEKLFAERRSLDFWSLVKESCLIMQRLLEQMKALRHANDAHIRKFCDADQSVIGQQLSKSILDDSEESTLEK